MVTGSMLINETFLGQPQNSEKKKKFIFIKLPDIYINIAITLDLNRFIQTLWNPWDIYSIWLYKKLNCPIILYLKNT